MTDSRPEYDSEIEICGEPYLFRREHALLRRLEQRFGALLSLARRAESYAITQAEMVAIYEEILHGHVDRPQRAAIERWVWDEGTPKLCVPLARILYELPMGNRTLRLLEEERRAKLEERREREESVRPTGPLDGAKAATATLESLVTNALKTRT